MKNIRLYELDSNYQIEKDTHEYPTVSYCRENDTVYYVSNATTFEIDFIQEDLWRYVSPNITSQIMTFEYEEGMTWTEWCESEYNIIGIYPFNDGDYVGQQDGGSAYFLDSLETPDNHLHADEVITSQTYIMGYVG